MSSAVESFGPASAAAAHPYAHHNHFAIAAAAAGSATAAAAAIIPSHHHHHHHQSIKLNTAAALEHQFALNHSSIYSNTSVSTASNHIANPHLGGGLFLPPPPPPLSLITSSAAAAGGVNTLPTQLVLSSKCSPQEQPKSPRDRSPRSKTASFQVQDGSCANNMSSAEFARPHPKQPRYTNNNNNNNNNNIINNNNNSNNNNNNNTNNHLNNNYTSNAIPIQLRSSKVASSLAKNYNTNNLNNNNVSTADKTHSSANHLNNHNGGGAVNKPTAVAVPRAKYSNEQSGPVNLVTNNNTNLVGQNHTNHNRTPPTSLSSESSTTSLGSDVSECGRKPVSSDMYAQKMSFTAQSLVAPGPTAAAAAAAAAAFQYNYPHMYPSRPLYGTPLFPTHLGHHNTIRPCPTYLSSQHEAYSPYHQAAAGVYQTGVPSQPQPNVGIHRTTPQVLINNTSMSQPGKPSSPLERICSYPQSNSKDISKTNGTYLNGKVNTSPAAPESVTGFKVPSGKEGSLKHRILTRPSSSDREANKRRSPITASVVKSNNNSSTSNFTKGACIELANGVLRRVEDMRTEDFIQSAEKSPIHQLAESTVVKITTTSGIVTITFSYDKNRSKADVEVPQEHPFFVYGQGWASCNPDLTLKSFGLKCQRLQVGDICISLKSRDSQSSSQTSSNSNANVNQQQNSVPSNQTSPSQNYEKSDASLPQNLSRKLTPHSNENVMSVAATTINNVTNRLASMGAPTYIPSTHNPYEEAAAAAIAYENQISRHHEYYQAQLQLHNPYHRLMGHPDVTLSSASRVPLPPPPPQSHSAPVQQSRPTSNQSSYYAEAHVPQSSTVPTACSSEPQQQPVDASLSRKRRWSAPESICDDDENECSPPAAHRLSNTNAYNP